MRTTATALLAAALLLTGCGSSGKTEPAETITVTAPAPLSKDEITAQCADAVAEAIAQRPDSFDPETDSDPVPEACEQLPDSDYLDAYMDGIQQANQAARDSLGDCLDDINCTRWPLSDSQ